jgi:hypothetical protein
MNRYFIYISVAILTFTLGLLISFGLFEKVEIKTFSIEKLEKSFQKYPTRLPWERPWKTNVQLSQAKEFPTEPFCKDAKILPIWNQLIKDKSFKDWWKFSEGSFDCANALEIKEFDLNNDGQNEFLLRGKNPPFCSAVGNCAFWIYQKEGQKYRKLLYSTDYADISELPNQVKETKTNGFSDIVLKGHITAGDTSYYFYKFDGKKYKQNKCLVNTYIRGTSDNSKQEFISCKEFYKRWESE